MLHIAEGYCCGWILCMRSMVGPYLCMNLQRITFWRSVFVLNAVLLDSQSTSFKVYLVHPVFSRMYWVSGGPWISFVICVFSFLLLMMSLEKK